MVKYKLEIGKNLNIPSNYRNYNPWVKQLINNPGTDMKNRKQILIDKKFQLTKSLTVIGFVSSIVIAIIVLMGVFILSNNEQLGIHNQEMQASILDVRDIMELQQSIFISLSSRPTIDTAEVDMAEANQLNTDYNNSIKKLTATIKKNETIVAANKDLMDKNNWLVGIVVGIFILGILILYFQMIRFTHRISGPIFVMTRYMKEILEGKKPTMYDLREKDEFKDFYELFRKVTEQHIVNKN